MRTNQSRFLLRGTLILLSCLLIVGCGKRPLSQESLLDSPQTHVEQALRLLDRQDLSGAGRELDRALALDPDYYRAHAVQALLLMEQGLGEEALEQADRAVKLADNRWESWTIKARVLAEFQPKDWRKQADKALEEAGELGGPRDQLAYWKGEVDLADLNLQAAVANYAQAVAGRGEWAARADSRMEMVNQVLRARPGTKVSSKVALEPELDRADMAVLLVEELKLPAIMDKARAPKRRTFEEPGSTSGIVAQQASDVEGHWAQSWINDVVRAGGMSLGAEKRFHPEELLSRSEFSMIMVDILVAATGDKSLATKHFGEQSMFPDLPSSHPAYNAAALCASRGLLQADMESGNFEPEGSISGAEALLGIRKFQNILRQEF